MNSKLRISDKKPLKKPQHYHVEMFCYEEDDPETHNFSYSTRFELIGNDLELIRSRAESLAEPRQRKSFIKDVKQCSDPQHLEELDVNLN